MAHQKIPIGIEMFDTLRREDFYYVDKTILIRDLLDNWASVNLFTRPRRFGKTLLMTTLKCFFEKSDEDNSDLFRGLAIERAGEAYMAHQGRYPVVFLSLKDVEGNTFDMARSSLANRVSEEALRHPELAASPHLGQVEIDRYRRLCARTATPSELYESIRTLSTLLEKHHGEKTVVLIDEYDVPLDRAYLFGYYDEMISLMRSFLGQALKTNPALRFAVLTGCLRISRESIFTGLNNLEVLSILDPRYSESFGFTQAEVEKLYTDYGVSHRLEDARAWYDGYRFGDAEVYNPWDILNFCKLLRFKPDAKPQPYWVNTSGNDFILRFLSSADSYTRDDIERLIDGQTIHKVIHSEITYGEIDKNPENLWSLLLLTGYLTIAGEESDEGVIPLRIPNAEVRQIFIKKIAAWFQDSVAMLDLRSLYGALRDGDAATVEVELSRILLDTISYHDAKESFYHGFLIGLLKHCNQWSMSSNREAGYGRGDILLEGRDRVWGSVIEIKAVQAAHEMEAEGQAAIRQIRERAYAHTLEQRGYDNILLYGIVFCGKTCQVICERG